MSTLALFNGVESGEGIESINISRLIPRSHHRWNPVKELKGSAGNANDHILRGRVESGEGIESFRLILPTILAMRLMWNPVKELKVLQPMPCLLNTLHLTWNPVKELKGPFDPEKGDSLQVFSGIR